MQWETKAVKFAREGKPNEAKVALLESMALRKKYLGGEPPAVETMRPIIGSMMGSIQGLEEAVGLLDKILTPAVIAQPEFGDLIFMRAELRGWQGRWQLALPDADFLAQQQPDNNYRYPPLAALLVATTNLNAYQKLCSNSLVHFSKTTNVFVADQTAKDCLILPSAGVDLNPVTALARFAVTRGKDETLAYHSFQCCHALAQYRIGNYQEATIWAQESAKNQTPEFQAEAYAVLAMAHHKLGNNDAALQALTNCTRVIETKLPKLGKWLGKDWKDWIIAHALEAEAKQLIDAPAPSTAGRADLH
jgi:tetratricopeptide (TPR) repeat protein